VALLDSPQDIEPLAPLVLREITYRVLSGPHGSRLRQIASAGAPAQRIAVGFTSQLTKLEVRFGEQKR
jgi:hypothetical protein